jgi:parallel beta-helix repeat protein
MLKKKILVALFTVLFLVSFINVTVPVNAHSTVIHVYNGQSIQAAIDAASDGDKIIVHEGTYYQSFSVNKGLKILGLHAIIDLEGTGSNTAIYVNVGGVTISGFTIRNIPTQVDAAAIRYPVPNGGVSGGLIENNKIYSGFYGIVLNGLSDIEIRNNWIQAVNPIYLINTPNVVVKNNVVSAHKLEGTSGWPGSGITVAQSSSGLIQGNEINSEWFGINLQGSSNIEVKNNRIYTSYYGINVNNSPNVVIKDNIVSAQATPTVTQPIGIRLLGAFSGGSIKNNRVNSEYGGIMINGQSDIMISDNKVTAVTAIRASNAPNVVIEKNAVHGDDCGIVLINAFDATVMKNQVCISKGTPGPSPPYWIGIFLTGTGSNIAENVVSGDFECGISIGSYSTTDPYSTGNTVCKNRITGGITPNDVGVNLNINTSENNVIRNKISGVDTPISNNGLDNVIKP